MNHNTKKKGEEEKPNIELDDLTSLENDLNALTGATETSDIKLNLSDTEPIKLNVDNSPGTSSGSAPTMQNRTRKRGWLFAIQQYPS